MRAFVFLIAFRASCNSFFRMGQKSKAWGWLALALFCVGLGTAGATTFLELQSSYVGDGWFQYRMKAFNDPFFTQGIVVGSQIGFTNEIDHTAISTNWAQTGYDNAYASWAFTNGTAPPLPYEITWLIRSSETTYKLQTNVFNGDVIMQLSLAFADIYPGVAGGVFSQNIMGCAGLPCLVPCASAEADGSPAHFNYKLKLAPDVLVNHLIHTNGEIHGVDFMWDSEATFMLQGTKDFNNWTNVAPIWSYPPETSWTTNVVLNDQGSYFRLQLMTDGHNTNLSSLVSNLAFTPKIPNTPPVITSCRLTGGNIVVVVSSNPGQSFTVQALDSRLVVRQSQQAFSSGTSTTVNFVPASLPNPVFFRVVLNY